MIVGQGRRSKVKVKFQKSCFDITVACFKVNVKGQGQGHRSGSRSWIKVKGQGQISGAQQSILGARLCRVQQRAIKGHYQSKVFVCVSVISGHMRIIKRMRSIGF